jgi:S1-C subfamily serine protease
MSRVKIAGAGDLRRFDPEQTVRPTSHYSEKHRPGGSAEPASSTTAMIESLLLTTARVSTFFGTQALTGASGFFFQRDRRLYLVTNRHVLIDRPTGHLPDRIEIELHTDIDNLTHVVALSVLLYRDGRSVWHQGRDSAGEIDVAAIELDPTALPPDVLLRAFTPEHLQHRLQEVKVGTPLLVVGYPLGFHDTLHHLPVVRQAVIASSFGLRFQGQGYFLTDARTHRGTSGAPVVMHDETGDPQLPWKLLGVHSARLEMGNRNLPVEEALALNCAWYADILLTLTAATAAAPH